MLARFNEMESNHSENTHQFNLQLNGAFQSLSYYKTDEDGQKHIVFDPQVYLARYSAVNAVLSIEQWKDHIGKVQSLGKKKLN